jgi:hypothetical protein
MPMKVTGLPYKQVLASLLYVIIAVTLCEVNEGKNKYWWKQVGVSALV